MEKGMEEEAHSYDTSCSNYDTSWSSTTNWTVADGLLEDSITFESSFCSSVDDDSKKAGGSATKSPLILCPPSSDPEPCEITITFPQRYEIQQVYVRSTARVYEVYYAPDNRHINDYLCTVRCGIAARDDEVLCTSDVEKAALAALEVSDETREKRAKNFNNLKTNEDGWVEVKSSDDPEVDNMRGLVPSPFDTKPVESTQDLYEATAEISDADLCMSITLRLLSLQNKGCVFVDEIYVFGEYVGPADSENQVSQVGNSAGSSLMAMFMPTLLQISKTRNPGPIPARRNIDTSEEKKSQGICSKSIDSTNTNVANRLHQEENSVENDEQKMKLPETVGSFILPAQVEMPPQDSRTESGHDSSCSHVEKVLDQLVSRVSRIEDLFLRFEECMVKPINSIEARLQQVEEQLQELNKKTQMAGLSSAPEFSPEESGDNPIYHNENDVVESEEEDSHPSKHDDISDMAVFLNANQSYSSLVITAPEYSSAEDEEEKHKQDVTTNFLKDKPEEKFHLQLALAIAGLLSPVSGEPQKYTQALAIKAPDFPEEDSNSDKKASPEVEDSNSDKEPRDSINDSMQTSTNFFSLESENSVDDHLEETIGVNNICQHKTEEADTLETQVTVAPVEQDVGETSFYSVTEDTESIEASNGVSNMCVSDGCKAVNQSLESRTENGSNTSEEVAIVNSIGNTTEVVKESESDMLRNFLELTHTSSVVNFDTPILDVKFGSQEHSNPKSPLEALLGSDMPEPNVKDSCVDEVDDGSQSDQQCNLIPVDDGELTNPVSGNHISLDANYCSFADMPLNVEDKKLQDCDSCNTQVCTASLI